ncbi:MAG: cation diffusion facilitator family transporter [Candidatus Falkowbacteria bacterium]|nr:cation diffusion facilitator family transporter [Candidatus Falkowbacteria bacterium]
MNHSKTAGYFPVFAAIFGNAFVALIKMIIALMSGSSVLLSESIHSVADTLNQTFLLIGLKRSVKKPSNDFGYGYGQERFFWALISACGIFFIGAGATAYQGVSALFHEKEIFLNWSIFLVLIISFVVEGWTFLVAARELKHSYPNMTYWKRMKVGDPTTLAVFFEDGVAVIGIIIAFISIILTKYTGHHIYDALGSIVIGLLLGAVAIILILKNRSYLLGRSIPHDLEEDIIELLEAEPAVEKVIDFKSSILDIGVYRIKCEIEFNGYILLKEIYRDQGLREQYDEIKDDFEDFKKFCVDFADRIPRLVGKKIDDIEKKLKAENPHVKYIDIEIN